MKEVFGEVGLVDGEGVEVVDIVSDKTDEIVTDEVDEIVSKIEITE